MVTLTTSWRSHLVALLWVMALPVGGRAAPPTLAEIEAMQVAVEQRGLTGLLAGAGAHGWQAPMMPSAWHVGTVSPPAQQPYLTAARELGSRILTAIDAWAPAMRTESVSDALAKAETLMDVSDWLGATEGYGNLMLTGRARDVAVTGFGRAVADLSTAVQPAKGAMQRLRAPYDAPLVRARVLNLEAGQRLFPTQATVSEADIVRVWNPRRAGFAARTVQALATPDRTTGRVSDEVREVRDLFGALGVTPSAPHANDAFFVDDPPIEVSTTRRLWDRKRHAGLLVSPMPERVASLEMLLRFRETIGAFPDQPRQRRETASSPGEEAFATAWRPHIGQDTFNLGRGAWSVYDQIRTGAFLDFDTQVTLAAASRAPLARTPSPPAPIGTP